MKTISVKQPINLKVVRFELDFSTLIENPNTKKQTKKIKIPKVNFKKRSTVIPNPPVIKNECQKRNVKDLIEELLDEIYSDQRDWSGHSAIGCSHGSTSTMSLVSSQSNYGEQTEAIERSYLEDLDIEELQEQRYEWENKLQTMGDRLSRSVRARDRLRRQQKRLCAAFTVLLRHISGESGVRFGLAPSSVGSEGPGEGGYAEWLHAMRLVARLPAGVPQHFRKKLWITLADRHLSARGIDWTAAERACFRGTALPDDAELGAQILKDLHRTGCSLFCGTEGRENQAMLRRVLLAYARWNKEVGYCQGFNMLAAIILEVTDKSESDSLKVMIYLVEAVLPEGYFADDLRGLSADMAAFRDLLRLRLPRLAQHMDHLQRISDGGGVEPPLPDVFTMQWFLTLYATWLPRESLLRIWDLILLDGNEVLLLTALGIWDMLQDRILSARSADEFYSCMGGGAGAVWEAGEALVARVVAFGSAPELPRLRSIHRYRVSPPAPPTAAPMPVCQPPLHSAMQSMTKRGLRLFYSEDEGDSSDDGNKMALATVMTRREDRLGAGDRLSLDIGALKRQYARLRERQRQAHVILAAACARHAAVGVPTSPTSLTVNNLLLGKSAIVSSRGRRLGPPPGAVPPSRVPAVTQEKASDCSRTRPSDTISWKEEQNRKSLSRRNSVKWKDIKKEKEKCRKTSIDLDETGDGVIVSETEANQMIATLRSRSSSETSSYSSHSASSTDTSLCDENERASDSEPDLPEDNNEKTHATFVKRKIRSSPIFKDTKINNTNSVKQKVGTKIFDSGEQAICSEKSIKSITDYLDSAAGEPLRTYIDGFETKLKDSVINNQTENYIRSNITTYSRRLISEKDEVLQRLNRTNIDESFRNVESIRPTKFSVSPKKFAELSPIDLSPYHYRDTDPAYSYNVEFTPNISLSSLTEHIPSRPPDIIDSFTKYPNFVPDIDLSDKNTSDLDSSPRSLGDESVIVSEDEPPIPLKIDKYFEHSPEFFGARLTDPNSTDIPNRRSTKRICRQPKKPDSLTLKTNNSEKKLNEDSERASSLPQNHTFPKNVEVIENKEAPKISKPKTPEISVNSQNTYSPKECVFQTGRKNSERALQIIQENSKILSRILTKQNSNKKVEQIVERHICDSNPEKGIEKTLLESSLLKESTSDSIIGLRKRNPTSVANNDLLRIRPISIDDPCSLDARGTLTRIEEFNNKSLKSPSVECIVGNKTDIYGWENKGFLAKCEQKIKGEIQNKNLDYDFKPKFDSSSRTDYSSREKRNISSSDWTRSVESKPSVTLPSSDIKETSTKDTYDRRYTSDEYDYPFSSNYNDFVLSKASDICRNTVEQCPKICESLSKTDISQVSEFAHIVTSSISFTYEPSAEDDSPTGAKSNSSDTLCQITSLDQVSTPISPKLFPRDTPTLPKDYTDRSDKNRIDSDDTICSAITSLTETDSLSSLSYPRSPSTGSYHPFPSRPVMRMPKELGIRLGMYPKDGVFSPPK